MTALHRSSFGVQLLSGATDGSIHLCVHPSYMCSHCALTHIIAAVLSSRETMRGNTGGRLRKRHSVIPVMEMEQ